MFLLEHTIIKWLTLKLAHNYETHLFFCYYINRRSSWFVNNTLFLCYCIIAKCIYLFVKMLNQNGRTCHRSGEKEIEKVITVWLSVLKRITLFHMRFIHSFERVRVIWWTRNRLLRLCASGSSGQLSLLTNSFF